MKIYALIAGILLTLGNAAYAQKQDIVAVASSEADFSTLVSAVQAAGLVETLQGDGPFTVFAPNNAAFAQVPEKEMNSLLQPSSQSKLSDLLTYHVVAGSWSAKDLVEAIKEGGGKAELKTVQGQALIAGLSDDQVILKDINGNKASVVQTDVEASNGVLHVLDKVLMPVQETATSDMK